jgi:predicted glycosyltransferase
MFFLELCQRLESRGHHVFKTTRKYREVIQLLRLKGIDAKVVGEYGGKDLGAKLRASISRMQEMTSFFVKIKPDIAVSFSSPEIARVSYGLQIPHICVNDSPHAEAVARLTIPLAKKLLTPKVISKKFWTRFGIDNERIVQYNALDPWVWLKGFKPDKGIIQKLGLNKSKPILTFRTEESYSAYLLGKTKTATNIIPVIKKILESCKDLQIVVIPRYNEQKTLLQKSFKNSNVVVCNSTIDGASLLNYTAVFVGGGGTMSCEAALLGVPTFSFYPGKPFVILKYLVKKKLITHITGTEMLVKEIFVSLSNLEQERKRQKITAQRLVRKFDDPIETIIKVVEENN